MRTPQEYAGGHIAGALNIDHAVIAQEISKANVAKDDTVILYCRSGNRSGIAQETLKKMGYLSSKTLHDATNGASLALRAAMAAAMGRKVLCPPARAMAETTERATR